MNSEVYFAQQQQSQQHQAAPPHQQSCQQQLQQQQAQGQGQNERISLATSHRTNPHSYYAAKTAGGLIASGGGGRPGTEAARCVPPGVDSIRLDPAGPPRDFSGDPSTRAVDLGDQGGFIPRTPYPQNLGYCHQQQQQLEQQQFLQQQRWFQQGQFPPPSAGHATGAVCWMANAAERTAASSQFPDSPPDSSSEPYSPPNDNRAHAAAATDQGPTSTNAAAAAARAGAAAVMAAAGPLGVYMNPHMQAGHAPLRPPQQPAHMHAHCGTGLPPPSSHLPPHAAHPPQHQITLHPGSVAFNMSKGGFNPYGPSPGGGDPTRLSHPPQTATPSLNLSQQGSQYGSMPNAANNPPKKRKYSDSPPGTLNPAGLMTTLHINHLLPIKPEPCPPDLHYGMPQDCGSEDESYYDFPGEGGMFLDGTYQVIKWTAHQPARWATLLDESGLELPPISYRVDADKGFNFAPSDDAFVCQKKNHFQITVHIGVAAVPKFVRPPESTTIQPIDALYLHFYGVKMESQSQTIKIEQSQSDRSKKQFHAVRVEPMPDQLNKLTVGRLHFSETTTNNMRKKGKPNPDQRYFQLVVALQAHCGASGGAEGHMIAAHASERIIVRASNPGQFESDVDVTWNKGKTADSIFHGGRVGINTDSPDEALTVHGNLKVTGHIISPSDMRAKKDLEELDTREQLENISRLKVYKYTYKEEFSEYAGLSDDERAETGVLAQDVYQVLPDAVRDTGDVVLPNGQRIENFLVVNKDRIFIENVGAVKELCKVTDKLENRITEMEYISSKLGSKLRRKGGGSFISASSVSASVCSSVSRPESHSSVSSALSANKVTSPSAQQARRHHHQHRHRGAAGEEGAAATSMLPPSGLPHSAGLKICTNRGIQLTIIVLVVVMFCCLMSMTTLYLIDRKSAPDISALLSQSQYGNQTTPVYPYPLLPKHCQMKPQDCPIVCSCRPLTTTSLQPPPDDPGHGSPSGPSVPGRGSTKPVGPYSSTLSPNDINYNYPSPSSAAPSAEKNKTQNESKPKGENGTKTRNKTRISQHEAADGGKVIIIHPRERRETEPDLKAQIARVFFKQMNETISRSFCVNGGCTSDSGGNYSYAIPISPMFPRVFITLKFLMLVESPSLVITLCRQDKEQSCPGGDTSYDFSASQLNSLEWDVPAGYYINSFYKFRVSAITTDLCARPDSEAGLAFAEYNFSFHRVCAY